mmetsp:Transcript_54208/g.80865  ORF Transcript_54208/g.80865 Transcript_54208/m.80865 type:complete len:315 (-) Transcript_54208:171-1115(-)
MPSFRSFLPYCALIFISCCCVHRALARGYAPNPTPRPTPKPTPRRRLTSRPTPKPITPTASSGYSTGEPNYPTYSRHPSYTTPWYPTPYNDHASPTRYHSSSSSSSNTSNGPSCGIIAGIIVGVVVGVLVTVAILMYCCVSAPITDDDDTTETKIDHADHTEEEEMGNPSNDMIAGTWNQRKAVIRETRGKQEDSCSGGRRQRRAAVPPNGTYRARYVDHGTTFTAFFQLQFVASEDDDDRFNLFTIEGTGSDEDGSFTTLEGEWRTGLIRESATGSISTTTIVIGRLCLGESSSKMKKMKESGCLLGGGSQRT